VDLQSKLFQDKIHHFIENNNVLISTSPVVLAAEFVQTAEKSTLLHQILNIIKELLLMILRRCKTIC
jgi:hypothetical protein